MLEGGTESGSALLAISGLTSGYGSADIVRSVSLELGRGEIVALMGKNGMGKTTLLKTVMGFLPLRSGSILLEGASLAGLRQSRLVALGIGYAPQELPLFQDLSIRDNLRLATQGRRDFAAAVERAVAHFPFLGDRMQQPAGTLSGGEQKMLIIARSLMLEPKLLLIDEISEGLQPSVIDRVSSALKAERDRTGMAVLLVEQNLRFALAVADRWAVLKLGEVDDRGLVDARAADRIMMHLKI